MTIRAIKLLSSEEIELHNHNAVASTPIGQKALFDDGIHEIELDILPSAPWSGSPWPGIDGYIEIVTPAFIYNENILHTMLKLHGVKRPTKNVPLLRLVVDENGYAKRLPMNSHASLLYGAHLDASGASPVLGTVYVIGVENHMTPGGPDQRVVSLPEYITHDFMADLLMSIILVAQGLQLDEIERSLRQRQILP